MRSLLLPGWGQLATRQRALGRVLMAVTFILTASIVGLVVGLGPAEMAARLADPMALLGVLALNLILAVVRLVSTTHAWWATGGRNPMVGIALAALVMLPHIGIAWVGSEARGTLLTVFVAAPPGPPSTPATRTTTTSTTTPITSTSVTTTPPTTSSTTTSTTTTTPATTSTTSSTTLVPPTVTTLPFTEERLDVLVLGGDAGPGRAGLRTDTIMVASIDPRSGDAALFGLPRNYGGITFSDGTPFKGRILNEVYGWGRDHPEAFGGTDPGVSALADVVEHLTGLGIDYYMLVDLTGFGSLIDVFGGVTLTVPESVAGPLYDPASGGYTMIQIPAGEQTLDGGQALAYARARYGANDYVRMGRQRCVLAAMVDQVDPVSLFTRLPALLDTVETHLRTDMPVDLVPDLIRLTSHVAADEIRVVGFGPEWGEGRNEAGYIVPDVERIRATVTQTIAGTGESADFSVAGTACL